MADATADLQLGEKHKKVCGNIITLSFIIMIIELFPHDINLMLIIFIQDVTASNTLYCK